MNIVGATV